MLSQWTQAFSKNRSLDESQAYSCFQELLTGTHHTQDIVDLLLAIHQKGVAVDELVGFSKAMRQLAVSIPLAHPVMDICGTGGSGKNRFNISTAAAFVLAYLGVPIAKHGNKGSRQANGSFDLLEALSIPYELQTASVQAVFQETKLAFLFARQFHPAVGRMAAARKEVGGRTVFNLLGPLCNPAHPDFQVMGTSGRENAEKLALTLSRLGVKRAVVIAGFDGLDEVSTAGPSYVFYVSPDKITEGVFEPEQVGISLANPLAIEGGNSQENAILLENIFRNKTETTALSEMLALNVAFGLFCSGSVDSIGAGCQIAKDALASGKVWDFFCHYRTLVNSRYSEGLS